MTKLVTIFILFFLSQECIASESDTISIPSKIRSYISNGWGLLDTLNCDLNKDGIEDYVLTIVQITPPQGDSDTYKVEVGRNLMLIILLGKKSGEYEKIGSSEDVLICEGCGGLKEHTEVQVLGNILLVYDMSGSSLFSEAEMKFRFDTTTHHMRLIGSDQTTHNGLNGDYVSESTNNLSGKRIVTYHKYRHSKDIIISKRIEKIPKHIYYLEDIGNDDLKYVFQGCSKESDDLIKNFAKE